MLHYSFLVEQSSIESNNLKNKTILVKYNFHNTLIHTYNATCCYDTSHNYENVYLLLLIKIHKHSNLKVLFVFDQNLLVTCKMDSTEENFVTALLF